MRRDSLAAVEKQVVYQRASNALKAKENCSEPLVSAEKYSEAFFPLAVTRDASLARAFHQFGEISLRLSLQLAFSKCLAKFLTTLRNSHHVGEGQWRNARKHREAHMGRLACRCALLRIVSMGTAGLIGPIPELGLNRGRRPACTNVARGELIE